MSFSELKQRRSKWQQLCLLFGLGVALWTGTHLAVNYKAYAQIVQFKWNDWQEADEIQANTFAKPIIATTPKTLAPQQLVQAKSKALSSESRAITFNARRYGRSVLQSLTIMPSDNRIVIPRIHKNLPLISVPSHQNWNQLENNIQSGLRDGVVVHPVSHGPGNYGNFFVTGHSSYYPWDSGRFKDVFVLLHEVEVGELVEVYWEGQRYVYRITQREVVEPHEVDVLNQPKDKSIITLMTCTPVGTDSQRLILRGELRK